MAVTYTDKITEKLVTSLASKAKPRPNANTDSKNPEQHKKIKLDQLIKQLSLLDTKNQLHGTKSNETSVNNIIEELSREIEEYFNNSKIPRKVFETLEKENILGALLADLVTIEANNPNRGSDPRPKYINQQGHFTRLLKLPTFTNKGGQFPF